MAKVNVVYDTLKDAVNKNQRGYISPAVFNSFAGVAQINIYNRLFTDLKDSRRNRRANFDPSRDKSLEKRAKEDLAAFSRQTTLTKQDGVFGKPNNLSRIISATTFGSVVLGTTTRKPIELIYDDEKIDHVLRSDVAKPTASNPVALVSKDIEVFPQTINKIQLRYYKTPSSKRSSDGSESANNPTYGYITVNGIEVFAAASSYDFELPDHYVPDLVVEIAKLAGLSLRDNAVTQFAMSERMRIDNEQSFG